MTPPDTPTRRDLLTRTGMGFGLAALTGVCADDARATPNPMAPKRPHFKAKAKHVIHLFMNGGPSHVDTFDPKPALEKWAGKSLDSAHLATERKTGAAMPSDFKFTRYGQSGIPVSEIFRHVGDSVDDMTVIRSMHADVPNHEPSLMLMNCGASVSVRPSVGSWVTYGLGTENQNLPGFVVLCPNGMPITQSQNWRAAFLPGAYQGIHVDTKETDVNKLISNIQSGIPRSEQRRQLDLLQALNRRHLAVRERDAELNARIHSFELAYRMQMAATDAFDINKEPKHIREMYGNTVQARQTLIARRLVERGVRYVQLYHGADQPWDSHDRVTHNHRNLAGQWSPAIGALLRDLRQRGLLDETLVIWGGEFGRTPTVELPMNGEKNPKMRGRDHNHYGFSMWLAGGGVKGGHIHGATDEFGFQAIENRVHVHDLHATMLHLLGFDHEKFTYRYAGRDFRLTDVHGHVIHDIIA